jgi:hypothetical protein
MPVIPAMWKAEIGRLQLEASLAKKLLRLCLKNKLGIMGHAYSPSYSGDGGRRIVICGQHGPNMRSYLKNKLKNAKGLGVWPKW